MLAFFLDVVIVAIGWWLTVAIGASLGDVGVVVVLVGAVALFAYQFLLEGLYGYTPGKYLLGLVVVKSDGADCTVGASVLRNVLWFVDALPAFYLIAGLSILLTDENQRVGDLVADTVVVVERR